jgi:hypothetical protein
MRRWVNIFKSRLSTGQKESLKKRFRSLLSFVPYRQSLDFLAIKYGTDKRSHGYTRLYQNYFEPLRLRKLNILEIGVGGYQDPESGGASLKMWQDYFPVSMIYAVDVFDKRPLQDTRIQIFQGSQNDPGFLKRVVEQIGRLDIVIDDGSHESEHIITSFNTLFPLLAQRGIYVIEDLQTSYWPKFGGDPADLNNPATSMGMLKRLADGLNHGHIPDRAAEPFDANVMSVHFYRSIAFIFKGQNPST